MQPDVEATRGYLERISRLLSHILSERMILYNKGTQYHWNTYKERFIKFHQLFKSHYKQLQIDIDEVAEKINALGDKTIRTMTIFTKFSTLAQPVIDKAYKQDMIRELVEDHERVIIQLRKNIEESNSKYQDTHTADFLIKLMQQHETTTWVLRKYLC